MHRSNPTGIFNQQCNYRVPNRERERGSWRPHTKVRGLLKKGGRGEDWRPSMKEGILGRGEGKGRSRRGKEINKIKIIQYNYH